MLKPLHSPKSISAYIETFPQETKQILEQVRSTIAKAAPQATEAIAYGIPTFKLNGNLVHFGGYKNHIGFYPGAEAVEVFKNEFSPYQTSKGTVQFPLDKPLPFDLITKITHYRVEKNLQKKK